MVDEITETNDSKAAADAIDRARLARERREAEQRRRLDELRAHAAAAQAQREKREEERRRRQAEQRARDDDRRSQVEERKRAIWETTVSRREALLAREREREERLERSRAARTSPRSAFAFGSSTPRLLEPVDTAGFFWAARRAASTTNVMFASAPLTRRASALQLDSADNDNKDEPERSPQQATWTSVARRRTDLVPTITVPRGPGRAFSMSRLDRLPHGQTPQQCRSGDSTPVSRPGSALSLAPRRPASATRRPRPLSMHAGAGSEPGSGASTPAVSRDASRSAPREHKPRPRPLSLHSPAINIEVKSPGDGKPPIQRKPKLTKEERKSRGASMSISPASTSKEASVEKDIQTKSRSAGGDGRVSATEVTHKLQQLQIHQKKEPEKKPALVETKPVTNESKPQVTETKPPETQEKPMETVQQITTEPQDEIKHITEKIEIREEKREQNGDKSESEKKIDERKENGQKTEDDMTASQIRRITTEEQAKAALAERRRKAREEAERRAEAERLRLQREAEEEAERQRQEEERQRRDEEEARELAELQRRNEQEKLRKAIEAQQKLEREEAERKAKEEEERRLRAAEEEERKRALEEEARAKRAEAEREEKERLLRKQRVEAIMARTRLKKAEEDKKALDAKNATIPAPSTETPQTTEPKNNNEVNNGNANTADLLGLDAGNDKPAPAAPALNNGNNVADLLGLSEQHNNEDKPEPQQQPTKQPQEISSNGNLPVTNLSANISANFIQTERMSEETNKDKTLPDVQSFEDEFTSHNGHTHTNTHTITLQNAI